MTAEWKIIFVLETIKGLKLESSNENVNVVSHKHKLLASSW